MTYVLRYCLTDRWTAIQEVWALALPTPAGLHNTWLGYCVAFVGKAVFNVAFFAYIEVSIIRAALLNGATQMASLAFCIGVKGKYTALKHQENLLKYQTSFSHLKCGFHYQFIGCPCQ